MVAAVLCVTACSYLRRLEARESTTTVGTASSLRKFHPEDRGFQRGGPLRFKAARREAESGQILLVTETPNVRVERVSVSPLSSTSQVAITPEHVLVERVGYVRTRKPLYEVDYVGEWPDPRFPLEPFDLEPGHLQSLWVTVNVPPTAKAGVYRGEIKVELGDGTTLSVPVELTVWDFELPHRGRLKTAFGTWYTRYPAEWYGWHGGKIPEAYLKKMYDLLLAHRLNPISQYGIDMYPRVEHLDYCAERGLNTIKARATGTAKEEEFHIVRRLIAELKKRALFDGAYLCGFDEWPKDKYPHIFRVLNAWKQAVPEIPIMAVQVPNETLADVVDIWPICPVWYDPAGSNYDPESQRLHRERLAAGDELWCYVGSSNRPPFANWWIDSPATQARVLFWQTFKAGMSGFLYYATSLWSSNMRVKSKYHFDKCHDAPEALKAIASGKRWPEVPWNTFTFYNYNGDGLLVYPGPDETPYPSIRLSHIRDGVEEFEYLALLSDLTERLRKQHPGSKLIARAEEILRISPELTTDWTHFTDSVEVIEAERERVAACIIDIRAEMGD